MGYISKNKRWRKCWINIHILDENQDFLCTSYDITQSVYGSIKEALNDVEEQLNILRDLEDDH